MKPGNAAPAGERALLFVFITVMLNSIGIGLIMPVMPELLIDLIGDADVGAAAAWGGWLTLTFALMQFVMSPVLGNASDAWGRRPVMLISLFCLGIDYLLTAIAPTLALLFVARILAGASAATFSTANAFIADVTPPAKRAQNFGLTGAAFGVGFVLGPAAGGLLGEIGPRAPFYAAAALTFANFIFGLVALPESLKPENRRPFSLARANPLGAARRMLAYPAIALMMGALFLYSVAHYVYPVVWSYFTKAKFGWSPADIGVYLALVGVGFAVVQGLLIRRVIPRLGEAKTAVAALILDVATHIAIAVVWADWLLYAMIPVASLSALVTPAIQGLMSNAAADDQQGELQGAVAALTSLSFVVAPVLMTQLFFAFTTGVEGPGYPGAPFIAAACFSTLAILPLVAGLRRAGLFPSR